MRVYLSGKMGGRMGSDVLKERRDAIRACRAAGLIPIDPAAHERISPNKVVDMAMDYPLMKSFVSKDDFAVEHSDALLVLTGDVCSDGTWWEMGLMFSLHRPIVMVAPKRASGELMGFSNVKVSAYFATVDEAVKYLADNFKGAI